MSTALTAQPTRQELLVQLAEMGELEVLGVENLEDGDTGQPPRLRLSSLNSPIEVANGETAPPGSIVNTVTNKVYSGGVEVVGLKLLPHTRVMWPQEYASDNAPICASDNGKTPSDSVRRKLSEPRQGPCNTCAEAQWPEGGSPPCTDQRNFLVGVLEDDETVSPAILTMQRTSNKTASQFTSLIRMLNPKRPKSIMVTTRKEESTKGTYFIYICGEGKPLDLVQRVALRDLQLRLDSLTITADVKEQDLNTVETVPVTHAPVGEGPDDGPPMDFMDSAPPVVEPEVQTVIDF